MIEIPSNAPVFWHEKCPHCGTGIYHWLSRLDPESWTDEEFLKEHTIDPETKTVTRKPA
jgi:hypothetical protein